MLLCCKVSRILSQVFWKCSVHFLCYLGPYISGETVVIRIYKNKKSKKGPSSNTRRKSEFTVCRTESVLVPEIGFVGWKCVCMCDLCVCWSGSTHYVFMCTRVVRSSIWERDMNAQKSIDFQDKMGVGFLGCITSPNQNPVNIYFRKSKYTVKPNQRIYASLFFSSFSMLRVFVFLFPSFLSKYWRACVLFVWN